jgi:hypothetical protein
MVYIAGSVIVALAAIVALVIIALRRKAMARAKAAACDTCGFRELNCPLAGTSSKPCGRWVDEKLSNNVLTGRWP